MGGFLAFAVWLYSDFANRCFVGFGGCGGCGWFCGFMICGSAGSLVAIGLMF